MCHPPSRGAIRVLGVMAATVCCPPAVADTVPLEEPLARGAVILDHDPWSGLGAAVAGIGDIDGDGIDDFAVAAPVEGKVYIVPGRRRFPPTFRLTEDAAVRKIRIELDIRQQRYLFPAGDVDGDGFDDLYMLDTTGPDSSVLLVYGSDDLPSEFDGSEVGWAVRGAVFRFAGLTFAPIGDFNGDGKNEMVFGLWNVTGPLNEHGKVTILFGERDWQGDVDVAARLEAGGGLEVIGTSRSDEVEGFGFHVASAGDMNGDGLEDVIISDPRYRGLQGDVLGRVHILLGATESPRSLRAADLGERGIVIENDETATSILRVGAVFGNGHLDGDGLSEAGFSVLTDTYSGPLRGRMYAIHGGAELPARITFGDLEAGRFGFSLLPPEGAERLHFGLELHVVPDEDGDGLDEILAGRHGSDYTDLVLRGSYPLTEEAILRPLHVFLPSTDPEVFEERTQCVAGDLNGDGIGDYLVSHFKHRVVIEDPREGRVFVVFGGFETEELTIGRAFPSSAPVGSTVAVTISGTGFVDRMRVLFGAEESASVEVLDPHTLLAETPAAAAPATVDLVLVWPDGRQAELPAGFTFRGGVSLSAGELTGRMTVFRVAEKYSLAPRVLDDVSGDGIDDYALEARPKGSGRDGSTYLVYSGTRWPLDVDETALAEKSVAFPLSSAKYPPVVGRLGDLDGNGLAEYSLTYRVDPLFHVVVVFAPFRQGTEVTLDELLNDESVAVLSSLGFVSTARPAGDFDGDGAADLLLETPDTVTVVMGPIAPGLRVDLDQDDRVVTITDEPRSAGARAGIGDFNGDGRSDLAFRGDPWNLITVVLGHEPLASEVSASSLIAAGLAYELPYAATKDYARIAPAKDLNRDGFDDMLVGITDSEVGVLFGRAEPLAGTTWEQEVAGGRGFSVLNHGARLEFFGYAMDVRGDLDGDGEPDLIIGSPTYLSLSTGAVPGAVYIVHRPLGLLGEHALNDVDREVSVIAGFVPDDRFGFSVGVLGDQDGDGLSELFVEAPFHVIGLGSTIGLACLIPGAALQTSPPTPFRRGDTNADGKVDLSDAVYSLGYLFLGGPDPICLDAGDSDDSGSIDISDAVGILNFLFLSGPEPAPPFERCGVDATADGLSCAAFPQCP